MTPDLPKKTDLMSLSFKFMLCHSGLWNSTWKNDWRMRCCFKGQLQRTLTQSIVKIKTLSTKRPRWLWKMRITLLKNPSRRLKTVLKDAIGLLVARKTGSATLETYDWTMSSLTLVLQNSREDTLLAMATVAMWWRIELYSQAVASVEVPNKGRALTKFWAAMIKEVIEIALVTCIRYLLSRELQGSKVPRWTFRKQATAAASLLPRQGTDQVRTGIGVSRISSMLQEELLCRRRCKAPWTAQVTPTEKL